MMRLFAVLFALLPVAAAASGNAVVGVRLEWNGYDSAWRVGGADYETGLNRVVLILDERVGPHLYGGLRAGYVDVSQTGNAATAGLGMYGQSLGVRFGGYFIRTRYVTAYLQVDHDYLQADDGAGEQKTEFDWTESNLELGVAANLKRLRVSAAVYRYRVDGDQTQRGPVDNTFNFRQTERAGASVGVEFQVDPTGYIGVRAERGAREGLCLTFSRRF